MNAMRETYIDRMIRIYGLEHDIVIDFCRLCERNPDSESWDATLETLVKSHEDSPMWDED